MDTETTPVGDPADELERNMRRLLAPYGGPADRRAHDRALAYLLAHPDQAHPRLLALLDPAREVIPIAAINAIPLFGRAESIPVLEELLRHASDTTSLAAAQALAQHPLPGARLALLRGLRHPRVETVVAAIDGLLDRGDRSTCVALRTLLARPEYEVRYHAVQAAGRLGCLGAAELSAIAANDSEEDIRNLARQLKQAGATEGSG